MNKNFSSSKEKRCSINSIKIESELINSWLAKNSKNLRAKKNKDVGVSECPAPWG